MSKHNHDKTLFQQNNKEITTAHSDPHVDYDCEHKHHHDDEHCGCEHNHHHEDDHFGCEHFHHHEHEHCGCEHDHHHETSPAKDHIAG